MCGIIGYIGDQQAVPILLEGLRRMEYRGYDSAGVAVIPDSAGNGHRNGARLQISKLPGRIQLLEELIAAAPLEGTVGIAHTRWATHGAPTRDNAHPHTGCHGRIALVHNGIIENYAALRKHLARRGHTLHQPDRHRGASPTSSTRSTRATSPRRSRAALHAGRGHVRHRGRLPGRAGHARRRAQGQPADHRRRQGRVRRRLRRDRDRRAHARRSSTSTTTRWPCSRPTASRCATSTNTQRRHGDRARSRASSRSTSAATTSTTCSRRSSSSPRRVAERLRGRLPSGRGARSCSAASPHRRASCAEPAGSSSPARARAGTPASSATT